MPDTALRLIDTLRQIPRHPQSISTPRLKALLEQLGYAVTARMVQRDLEKLSHYGISCDEGKPKLWSWAPGTKVLDIPSLDPQAALTFALAQRHLQALLPASTLAYLDPYFATAKTVLDAHGNGLSRWTDKIRALPRGQRLLAPAVDAAVQATVYRALLEERRVQLSYLTYGSRQRKAYPASPLALVVRDRVVYLVCTLSDYQEVRQPRHLDATSQPARQRRRSAIVSVAANRGFRSLPPITTRIQTASSFHRGLRTRLRARPTVRPR